MLESFRIGIIGRAGTLFDGFDAAFREGEVWALTGPPASGKSRLLGVLHGDCRPAAGDVLSGGTSLYRGTPDAVAHHHRTAGLVAERLDAGAHTVGDLFRLSALAADDVPEPERKAREVALLSLVGLQGGADFRFASLSQSEQVRAAIAVELFRGPKVLLLDTPLARAGKEWMEMLIALFRALAREGRIVVFAERELPPGFPMKPVAEGVRSGPFVLTQLVSGAGEASR
ncbi:MAG TPA: ATP-binding cassette domain-containing protein [Candidatus Deferrimicrobiaceae bacterium]|jgi:ABC-type lipoprotein export system ATPase subunit